VCGRVARRERFLGVLVDRVIRLIVRLIVAFVTGAVLGGGRLGPWRGAGLSARASHLIVGI
jgi:hypothetical protein